VQGHPGQDVPGLDDPAEPRVAVGCPRGVAVSRN